MIGVLPFPWQIHRLYQDCMSTHTVLGSHWTYIQNNTTWSNRHTLYQDVPGSLWIQCAPHIKIECGRSTQSMHWMNWTTVTTPTSNTHPHLQHAVNLQNHTLLDTPPPPTHQPSLYHLPQQALQTNYSVLSCNRGNDMIARPSMQIPHSWKLHFICNYRTPIDVQQNWVQMIGLVPCNVMALLLLIIMSNDTVIRTITVNN